MHLSGNTVTYDAMYYNCNMFKLVKVTLTCLPASPLQTLQKPAQTEIHIISYDGIQYNNCAYNVQE
jgi:hypothetical protein